ncbi:MAG: hypothetical protein KAS82_07080 [Bacteroidales bacterium]|nr:hypothetical protein [Bacteroidales bacterium]
MKKRLMTKSDFAEKFRNEKIEGKKMNYLVGGDGDGSEGAPPDPWR